jgi:hypothetical protein
MFIHIGKLLESYTHQHTWTEWEKERPHYWSHVECLVQYCKKCGESQYRLLSLHCPQFKIKGEYCYWCKGWGKIWEGRLEKTEVLCNDDDMKKRTKKGRPFELLARNLAIALEIDLNQKTLRQVADEYKFKDHSSVRQIHDRMQEFLNVDKIREAVK